MADTAEHDKVILELDEQDTDQTEHEDILLDLGDDHISGTDPDEKTDTKEADGKLDSDETPDKAKPIDKDLTIAELTELNDKQLNKIIGTRHAEKEWANERAQLHSRITELETAKTAPVLSPVDKWLSEQKDEDRNELTEADIPLIVARAERAYQATQADTKTTTQSSSQDKGFTEQQVSDRLNEVWEDEDASILFHMADQYLKEGERTGIVGQLMNAKDGAEAARITKEVALAIIQRRGSDSLKAKARVFAPKSTSSKAKSTKSQQSRTDDLQGDDDALDFSGFDMSDGLFT